MQTFRLDTLVAPAAIAHYLKKVRKEMVNEDTMNAMSGVKYGIIIYHCPTRTYYAAVTTDPKKYFERLLHEPRDFSKLNERLPDPVRKMIGAGGNIEFYYYSFFLRNQIEQELMLAGFSRSITTPGSLITGRHLIYEVYSRQFNLARYVSCLETNDLDSVRKKADAGFVKWLKNNKIYQHKRDVMRTAMRFELEQKPMSIYKRDNTDVAVLERSKYMSVKQFRKEVERLNQESVDLFIARTTGVRQ